MAPAKAVLQKRNILKKHIKTAEQKTRGVSNKLLIILCSLTFYHKQCL